MKIIGIYIIFNRISKLVYVGSSFDINTRFRIHKNQLKNGNHHNRYLQFAYNKYGEDSLKFTCIKRIEYQIDDTQLRLLEQELIDKINPKRLYNLCPVAGSTKGKKHTQETRDKISKKLTGRAVQCRRGVQLSMEHKDKIRCSLKGKTLGKEFSTRQKPVLQIDKITKVVIRQFKSGKEAAAILGLKQNHIYEVCNNDGSKSRKTVGGFIWKYKNSQGIV